MLSICCSPPPPDIASLLPEERQKFGKMVHDLRRLGKDLQTAQTLAYSKVLADSVPDPLRTPSR
jgi:hypothetical protein